MDCYRYGQGCRSALTESVSLRRRALRDGVNFMNFAFWIKCHFNVFTVLLFYRVILIFLVQKFYYPVATYGHATSKKKVHSILPASTIKHGPPWAANIKQGPSMACFAFRCLFFLRKGPTYLSQLLRWSGFLSHL